MDDSTLSRGSDGRLQILRESEFYGGCIRVKISVKNTSGLAFLDVALELESDERILHFDRCEPQYPEKKGKLQLGNIHPGTDRTVAFYLDPLICAKEGTDINCRVSYKDASGRPDSVQMKTLKINVVCPIFRTEQEINIGRLKELIAELRSHDSKVYIFPKKVELQKLLSLCRDVIQLHDVRHIKTFKTTDEKTYESWYYGKTKVTKKDLVIKCAICKDTESIEIFVSGDDPKDITGLLAEIGRNLTKEFDKIGTVKPVFNVIIKNSMVKGSNLLSSCDLNGICGGNVVIEDSLVEGTNVASWMQEEKDKSRIEEQKKREEAQKREKEEAESRERGKARLEQDRLRGQKEEQDKLTKEEQERKEKAELSESEKKKGFSQIRFLAVALALGLLLLGYWALAPGGSDTSQSVQTTPSPAAAVVTYSADHRTITNSIGMEFALIPAGEFNMGSPSNEAGRLDWEGPVHHVKIGNALYMGKYDVTQKQWRDVMRNNPSTFKGDNLPVVNISWNDVQDFIKKLNEKEGGNKYRLPTEAEWEYAARAGTTTSYFFGDDESMLGDYAWYGANSGSKIHDVGQKKPNPWGLYDMYGNVWEWVQDTWHENYNGAPIDGSSWESEGGFFRVNRGGSWNCGTEHCRSARRTFHKQDINVNYLGFRLLRIS
jgi:formylglycine-generating enzyme required for sulfatase activity